VPLLHLQHDRNQHCVAGHANEISANIERKQVVANLRGNYFLKIFELDCRRAIQLRELLETIKLLALKILVKGTGAQLLQPSRKAIRFVRESHLLIQRESRSRNVLKSIF